MGPKSVFTFFELRQNQEICCGKSCCSNQLLCPLWDSKQFLDEGVFSSFSHHLVCSFFTFSSHLICFFPSTFCPLVILDAVTVIPYGWGQNFTQKLFPPLWQGHYDHTFSIKAKQVANLFWWLHWLWRQSAPWVSHSYKWDRKCPPTFKSKLVVNCVLKLFPGVSRCWIWNRTRPTPS